MTNFRNIIKRLQNCWRRRKFREGSTLSRFIACDVRREILIISASRIDEGIITARVRTTNVLYLSKGLIPPSEFDPAREMQINEMWKWTGQSWGGLPDGTSIVDHLRGSDTPQDKRQLTKRCTIPHHHKIIHHSIMKETTKRSILRWIHIIFALPILAYIYGPQAEVQQYVDYFRFGYVPVVVVTGFWMWKGPAVRRLFSRLSGQSKPVN
jgi:hypothetical protein